MKKLRDDLDFTKTYGSVPDSFQARVHETLRRTGQTAQALPSSETAVAPSKPILRVAILVAALLALTATAVAAVLFQTGEFFLGPNGLSGATDLFRHDMEVGQKAYASASTQVGGVAFTLDDVLWGEDHIYATGTFQLAQDAEGMMLMDFGDEPHHLYVPYGVEREAATTTYAEYAAQHDLTLLSVEIWFDHVLDAQDDMVRMEASYYYTRIAEGVFRFGLMVFPQEEALQAAREGGYRGVLTLSVAHYGEGAEFVPPSDDDPWGYWLPGGHASTDWVLDLTPES